MSTDWLDGNKEQSVFATPAEKDAAKREQRRKAIEFAQIYLLFTDTEQGRELLKQWDKVHLYKRTPVDGTIQQYAADEAIRAFVAGIHRQIELAKQPME